MTASRAPAPAGQALRLRIVSGPDAGKQAMLSAAELVVGRDGDCDLVLADPKVSRRHAYLKALPGGGASLNELRATNGTWVDDRRVASEVLSGGERLRLGDTVIEVLAGEPGSMPPRQPVTSGDTAPTPGASLLERVRAIPAQSHSMLERAVLRRSVRRATVLAAVAIAGLAAVAVLFATGVLGGRPSPDERVERVVARVSPSTVLVQSRRGSGRSGSGTGWVLDAAGGLIVTNAHVVNAGSSFTVAVGDSLRRATVVGVAPCEDLAVLRVADRSRLRTLPLGRQSSLRLGETVVALGFPGNASLSDALTSTTGVVSVTRSAYREPALDVPAYANVVQTDAAINPGNSGGPLVDLDGRLVGVSSAGRTLSPEGRIIQGQSYAIGVDRVRPVVARLRGGRSTGWLGLTFEFPTARWLRAQNLPAGLLVNGVVAGSAAQRAGLAGRRLLITTVGGVPVANTMVGYCDAAARGATGQPVRVGGLDLTSRRPVSLALRWG